MKKKNRHSEPPAPDATPRPKRVSAPVEIARALAHARSSGEIDIAEALAEIEARAAAAHARQLAEAEEAAATNAPGDALASLPDARRAVLSLDDDYDDEDD